MTYACNLKLRLEGHRTKGKERRQQRWRAERGGKEVGRRRNESVVSELEARHSTTKQNQAETGSMTN